MPFRRASMHGALFVAALAAATLPAIAVAQDGSVEASDSGDTAWLLAATALLLIAALPGMALFQAGRTRTNAFVATLVQPAAVAAAVSLAWILVGYTLAFGGVASGWLGGGNALALMELGNVRDGLSVPESAFALFQIGCAMLAAVIMIGAWSGRARFGWVVLFVTIWSVVVLAPVMHWLWGGGWLASASGTIDFAGGTALEVSAGTSALVTAVLMGRGSDFDGERPIGLSPITLAGALLLWIGWFGLCGGSAFAANDDAASALISAHAAACAGGLARLLIDRLRGEPPRAESFALGLVSGLAAIASAALYVSPAAAALIGAAGSALSAGAAWLVRRLRIDDRLDVFALFAVPGAAGSLLVGVFMAPALGGTGYDDTMNPIAQIAGQTIGVVVVAAWSAIGSTVIALMASLAFPMRVSEASEEAGLDTAMHGER
ncbi:Amt family ammonium transporter [Novosphingobium chloroacetimidivorans]|uniref:Amt family ammonium transporter n=1 Tax=Novosphingobium chloroacetimidivorans TaxID=1428314 RepID=A0A7W7K716_9SPHN|nr:ammonium transporter [Novosphingobium chloroacetimidivorans]MBB4857115.1 Amt family ammonium transporter [Novosphingobium chloroacetimidivorans]